MNNNNTQQLMKEEIQKRLNSRSWNLEIAQKVIEKREQKKKLFIFTGSFSAVLATAASVVIAVFVLFSNETKINSYDQFITSQVNGTYNTVFSSKKTMIASQDKDDFMDDEVDDMIDDALAMR